MFKATVYPTSRRAYSIALVGLGHRGYGSHFLSLHNSPTHSIVAVCDTNHETINSFAAKHHDVPAYTSLTRLLHSHRPDFALVCVPHAFHMDCITILSKSGVPVLKEKPIAESSDEFWHLNSLPVKIGVTFQKRFEPQILQFKRLLPSVGGITSIQATIALNITNLQATWRAACGVGVTEDLGCHMLDLVTGLFGLPDSLLARGVSSVRPSQKYGGEDISNVIMDWKGMNRIAHVHLSRVAHEWDESITVTGTKGTLLLDRYKITLVDTQGRLVFEGLYDPVEKLVIRSMVQQFGDWVTGRSPGFVSSLDNVRDTMAAVQAARTSLASYQIQHPLLLTRAPSVPVIKHPSIGRRVGSGAAASYSQQARAQARNLLFPLNTGDRIPAVGLGTRRCQVPGQVRVAVQTALQAGYRHIDTAQSSDNEDEVGKAIRDSGVSRDEIWITTKLDNKRHNCVDRAIESSLHALGVDYVDLFLMHWPISVDPDDPSKQIANWDFVNTWQMMQGIPASVARNIGVSNFGISHLQKLLNDPSCTTVPAVNQIELHPCYPSPSLLKYCTDLGIHCTAYSCLGSYNSALLECSTVIDIARKKQRTKPQVLIMWGLQRGTSVIPKSVNPSRIEQNFELDGWSLTDEEMDILDSLRTHFKSCGDDWLPGRVF